MFVGYRWLDNDGLSLSPISLHPIPLPLTAPPAVHGQAELRTSCKAPGNTGGVAGSVGQNENQSILGQYLRPQVCACNGRYEGCKKAGERSTSNWWHRRSSARSRGSKMYVAHQCQVSAFRQSCNCCAAISPDEYDRSRG